MKATLKIKEAAKLLWIPLLVAAVIVVFDLVTKKLIVDSIPLNQSKPLIDNFLYFTYVRNTGAAFSMLEGWRTFFLILTPIVLAGFLAAIYLFRRQSMFLRITFALIIAGAVGNYVDRITLGYVRDFVHVVYFGHDLPLLGTEFAIFNVADAALTFGLIFFAYFFVFKYVDPKDKKAVARAQKRQEQAERRKLERRVAKAKAQTVEQYLAAKAGKHDG